jgi:hypothetical protein
MELLVELDGVDDGNRLVAISFLGSIVEAPLLILWGSSKKTPSRVCRRDMVGSLLRDMPKVVDCWQTGAQATN